jgi:hypothetical protein
MLDTHLRVWAYMSEECMFITLDLDKAAPAGELFKTGSRPIERLPLRHDLKTLGDFD